MTKIITNHIDLKNVGNEIKKGYYLDDDLIKEKIKIHDNGEKLIQINKDDKKLNISPFWETNQEFEINDPELLKIINIENIILKEYIKNNPDFGIFVRSGVYEKLIKASDIFIKYGYKISIKIGYRPPELQDMLFLSIYNYFSDKNKNLKKEEIYKITCQYVSDNKVYVSPHVTGGAVDIILIDKNNNEIDFGSPLNFPGEISHITYKDLTLKQLNNRNLLTNTMLSVGFSNLASEWWHFSYGDPYWAYFYGKKETLYSRCFYI